MVESVIAALAVIAAFFYGYKFGMKVAQDKETVESTTELDEFSRYLDGETDN